MGRLSTVKDQALNPITTATYDFAGHLLSVDNQTYAYNNLFQLTQVSGNGINMQYRYSATQNNGKIVSQYDATSGEEVTYAYDSLQRLASAVTTDNASVPQWGQSYTYDGWGNLTDQNVTKGSAPTMHVVVDATTNRANQGTYDANGNNRLTSSGFDNYDVDNRLVYPNGSSSLLYGYDPRNKRIYKDTISYSTQWNCAGEIVPRIPGHEFPGHEFPEFKDSWA